MESRKSKVLATFKNYRLVEAHDEVYDTQITYLILERKEINSMNESFYRKTYIEGNGDDSYLLFELLREMFVNEK